MVTFKIMMNKQRRQVSFLHCVYVCVRAQGVQDLLYNSICFSNIIFGHSPKTETNLCEKSPFDLDIQYSTPTWGNSGRSIPIVHGHRHPK